MQPTEHAHDVRIHEVFLWGSQGNMEGYLSEVLPSLLCKTPHDTTYDNLMASRPLKQLGHLKVIINVTPVFAWHDPVVWCYLCSSVIHEAARHLLKWAYPAIV